MKMRLLLPVLAASLCQAQDGPPQSEGRGGGFGRGGGGGERGFSRGGDRGGDRGFSRGGGEGGQRDMRGPQQSPPQQQQQQPQQSGGTDPRGSETGLGKSIPFIDPSTGNMMWDGYNVNITDNALFRARFEKYLASPPADSTEDQQYRDIIEEIIALLSPSNPGGANFPAAVANLKLASTFDIDAGLCDSLSNDIWAVWQSNKNRDSLSKAIVEMKNRARGLARNNETALEGNVLREAQRTAQQGGMSGARGGMTRGGRGGTTGTNSQQSQQQQSQQQQQAQQQANDATTVAQTSQTPNAIGTTRRSVETMDERDVTLNYGRVALYIAEIGELESEIALAKTNIAVSEVTMKMDFQVKITQFFLARRYEHALIACRFYRNIFQDGNSQLAIQQESDLSKMLRTGLGMAPTVGVLDSLSGEAMRDVDEAIKAFKLLVARGELNSAMHQLGQAFLIGEFMPSVRRLPTEDKMKILQYTRDSNQLIAALEVKDYELAEKLIDNLRKQAADFDYSKPRAAVETAKTVSAMHINAAKVAALNSDNAKVEQELSKAMEIWPTNPAIQEFSKMLTSTSDIKAQAVLDFDRLLSQKDYRQIFMDQGRYAGALIDDPSRQASMAEVLQIMNEITITTSGARAAAEHGDNWRAYEMVEKLYQEHGDDSEVSRMRSDLTRNVSEFVNALSKAEDYEKRDQIGASLTWYLKARNIYEGSTFAREGIDRVLGKMQGELESAAARPVNQPVNTTTQPLAPAPRASVSAAPPTQATESAPPAEPAPAAGQTPFGGPANGTPLTNRPR